MPTKRQILSRATFAAAAALATVCACAQPLHYVQEMVSAGARAPGPYGVKLQRSVFVPMRDGVRLSTDLYMPEGASVRLPVILMRTPYDKAKASSIVKFFVSHGYVVALQDLRGKYESEGTFFAYGDEGKDGYDTVTWLAEQPWSNANVGTFGCSYLGEVQHMLARLQHPRHKAAIIQGDSAYKNDAILGLGFRMNGAVELASSLSWNVSSGSPYYYGPPAGTDRQQWFQSPWAKLYEIRYSVPQYDAAEVLQHLPIIELSRLVGAPPNEFENWVREKPGSKYWDRQGGFRDDDRFAVPALHMTSWYDFTHSPRAAFNLYRRNATTPQVREQQYLVISPGPHCSFEDLGENAIVGERNVGDARYGFRGLYLDWFDHWLKGKDTPAVRQPKVQVYTMGGPGWRGAEEWPLRGARTLNLYLHSDGDANTRFGNGRLDAALPGSGKPSDMLIYDPDHPTPTRGGAICCTGRSEVEGAVDVADIETRHDTLVYTTAPLREPLEITGEVAVDLYVSSDAPDTDVVARLTEVDPAGKSWVLLDGIMRMRYSAAAGQEIRMKPGEIRRASFGLQATSVVIRAGHRIRLDVASAGFPRWDRNLNTGGNNYDETVGRVARNRIHHDAANPSRLVLTVAPP